jgi:hypothetical protein
MHAELTSVQPVEVSTLHPLRTRLDDNRLAIALAKARVLEGQREVSRLLIDCSRIEAAIKRSDVVEISVSEHALLRYAERALGFNPKEVADVVRERVEPFVRAFGDGKYPVAPGLLAIVVKRVVVSIVPA